MVRSFGFARGTASKCGLLCYVVMFCCAVVLCGSCEAHARAPCDLCADNWMIILGGGGRTGTTTALSMFNLVPGVVLSGEHFGVLRHAWQMHSRLKNIGTQFRISAFVGSQINDQEYFCAVQELVKVIVFGSHRAELEDTSRILGFKEIRYDSPNMIRFLLLAFPCARFIFSIRKWVNVPLKAEKEFGDPDKMRKKWKYSGSLFEAVNQAYPDSTAVFPVEDLTVERFNRFLTAQLGVKNCTFSKVDARNQGGTYSKEFRMQKSELVGACDLSGVSFRFDNEALKKRKEILNALAIEMFKIPRMGLNPDKD